MIALRAQLLDEITQCLAWRHSAAVVTRRVLAIVSQPETLAVRQCADCREVYGVDRWAGADAHPGEDWLVSHGVCQPCAEKSAREIQGEVAA